jgi:hypothetical protein
MGMGRWFLFILLVSVPLFGFGVMADASSGPYNVSCNSSGSGFRVIVTSSKTGQQTTMSVPLGFCPPG